MLYYKLVRHIVKAVGGLNLALERGQLVMSEMVYILVLLIILTEFLVEINKKG